MEKKKIDVKRIVYTIAMLLLCVVAFVRGVGGGDWWNAAVSCLGFALFPVIVMRYGFKSFLKIPYLTWLLISIPAAATRLPIMNTTVSALAIFPLLLKGMSIRKSWSAG